MRPAAALLALLLLLAGPVRAAPATTTPAAVPAQASLGAHGLAIAWRPPPGQALACVYRYRPRPMEPLGCVRGGVSALVIPPGGDVGLQVAARGVVELRSYDARGALVGRGRAAVWWRVWLPAAGVAETHGTR